MRKENIDFPERKGNPFFPHTHISQQLHLLGKQYDPPTKFKTSKILIYHLIQTAKLVISISKH